MRTTFPRVVLGAVGSPQRLAMFFSDLKRSFRISPLFSKNAGNIGIGNIETVRLILAVLDGIIGLGIEAATRVLRHRDGTRHAGNIEAVTGTWSIVEDAYCSIFPRTGRICGLLASRDACRLEAIGNPRRRLRSRWPHSLRRTP